MRRNGAKLHRDGGNNAVGEEGLQIGHSSWKDA